MYSIPTTTMVMRTRTNVTLYVHCLYCCSFRWFVTLHETDVTA